ncbi:class I SAM-dependent methyltransferase [Paenibacillus sp. PDC88]|uniref:class I SAM-dependent methyltransferase n=1 Tax=Paenibacillus sp. PDC88 TaxID=1884375 RepID=UPI00089CBFFE|nr:class I SAM-dependent methyltransferase [Paenibacillus sp. PDC88]SDW18195.1 Methyltransferase domain-containing protein [Paenibacillus sp. PDC88]
MDRQFEEARKMEENYHKQFYQEHDIYEEGTWMAGPMPVVMDSLARLMRLKQDLTILDLGAGAGRNTIAMAEKLKGTSSELIAVDLLEEAVQSLVEHAKDYKVDHMISAEQADIEHYEMRKNRYDYIAACSCLEHLSSEEALSKVIRRMKEGTKLGGINLITMSTNVEEVTIQDHRPREPLIELNLPTLHAEEILADQYKDWEILFTERVTQAIPEQKYDESTEFRCQLIRFAAQKRSE